MRAAIFIDAGYFLKLTKDAGVTPNYEKLASYFLEPLKKQSDVDLLRCYFYYCAPWMSQEPTDDELRRMEVHTEFVEKIEAIPRWQFRHGKLERRREGDKDVYAQKRVDVLLSVDLVRHAAAGHIQHAVLVAGDSDFIPAVAAAKESGVTLTLYVAEQRHAHRDLLKIADCVERLEMKKLPKVAAKSSSTASPGGRRGGRSQPKTSGPKQATDKQTGQQTGQQKKASGNRKTISKTSGRTGRTRSKPRDS